MNKDEEIAYLRARVKELEQATRTLSKQTYLELDSRMQAQDDARVKGHALRLRTKQLKKVKRRLRRGGKGLPVL